MIKKKINKQSQIIKAGLILTVGTIALLASPAIFYGLKALLDIGCEKARYGDGCTFEVDFPNTYASLFFAICWGVFSLAAIGFGIYLYYQSTRKR